MVNKVTEETWTTEMEVGDEIVQLLSGRIYRTLPIALKELVSNSWDADAKEVNIMIHEKQKQIAIMDDGLGMDREEIENYVNVAMSHKPKKDVTESGRPTIGQYGIGILSALPFCRTVNVETTKKGSSKIHSLEISSEKWIDEEGRRRGPEVEVLSHECQGKTRVDKGLIDNHGTSVIMKEVFPQEWEELMREPQKGKTDLMGYSGIDRVAWFLKQYAPIEFNKKDKVYKEFFEKSKNYPKMELYLNGKQLFRNAIQQPQILERGEKVELADDKVKCRYLIVTPGKAITPDEMRGVQLRMRNVAIGLPRHFDVYKRKGKLYGRMRYISGEIEIIEGLEGQLNLEREDIINCPEWEDFQEYFRDKLAILADSIEDKADAEKSLGALGYSLGMNLNDTNFGFVDSSAVRNSTKKRRALHADSKKVLKKDAKHRLKRIGYTFKELTEKNIINEKKPIVVDHKKKIVYLHTSEKEGYTLIKTKGININELEKETDTRDIAKMENTNNISFNYNHPIFNFTRDKNVVKILISIIYKLNNDELISNNAIKTFNRYLREVYEKDIGSE